MDKIIYENDNQGNLLIIDRTRKCHRCNANLVVGTTSPSNLQKIGNNLECIDTEECKANILAENTKVLLDTDGRILSVSLNNEELVQVDYGNPS